ncbi:MAG: sugar nucleotide-binding protein [Armatimonadetes bacterium]|nr:sugar nucleotide-binding protein [Armatimonadota bacterium]
MKPSNSPTPASLELWGGIECTVNRVGDAYFDQFQWNGHYERLSDLDLMASLGIRALRYPVSWERIAPSELADADWSWITERLCHLRALGVSPIAGLVHHGSGPRHTNLLDPQFPQKLAEFAREVATRFPWIEAYTPVNEPLTTARFSALYGHWYPHATDEASFVRALLIQCRATVEAMRAIREVNPKARLVQTEDLGKTHSTPLLSYQAEFENERRWITFDLLCGRVHGDHRMARHFRFLGIGEEEFGWFAENPCPPDVLGINHYLTSERFLDQRIKRYPQNTHGDNGIHQYADVEAVRVRAEGIDGPLALLNEAWERYHLPIAVTEAHLGCTREEQLRWLREVWDAAQTLREHGADIRAVTAWSLLGAHEWNSLLTRNEGYYEPGAFDLRALQPLPTAITTMLRGLARDGDFDHPVLAARGWWRDPKRLLYPPVRSQKEAAPTLTHLPRRGGPTRKQPVQPLLITGATGTLGAAFARLGDLRGLSHRLTSRRELDITDPASIEAMLDQARPWAVVNTAGYGRVDDAEREREQCFAQNADGPAFLAQACARRGLPLLTFSSDLVFDGSKGAPYVESDIPAPLSVYGQSKAEAERRVLAAHPDALVVRTGAFFGPWDEGNFVILALRALSAGKPWVAAEDVLVSPTYVPDLVHYSLNLLIDAQSGIWHGCNEGAISWADFARRVAERAGLDASLVEGRPTAELGWIAPRPLNCSLASERGQIMPSLDKAIEEYFQECTVSWKPLERQLRRAS